jgi:hypothetical protein
VVRPTEAEEQKMYEFKLVTFDAQGKTQTFSCVPAEKVGLYFDRHVAKSDVVRVEVTRTELTAEEILQVEEELARP